MELSLLQTRVENLWFERWQQSILWALQFFVLPLCLAYPKGDHGQLLAIYVQDFFILVHS